jgi:hypothetical protein
MPPGASAWTTLKGCAGILQLRAEEGWASHGFDNEPQGRTVTIAAQPLSRKTNSHHQANEQEPYWQGTERESIPAKIDSCKGLAQSSELRVASVTGSILNELLATINVECCSSDCCVRHEVDR